MMNIIILLLLALLLAPGAVLLLGLLLHLAQTRLEAKAALRGRRTGSQRRRVSNALECANRVTRESEQGHSWRLSEITAGRQQWR